LRTVLLARNGDRLDKTVLQQTQQREPVVSAIKGCQWRGKLHRVHAVDLPHKGRQVNGIEGAWRQTAPLPAQCGQGGCQPATEAAGGGEMGKPERVQGDTKPI
jgi:hypothetical protein